MFNKLFNKFLLCFFLFSFFVFANNNTVQLTQVAVVDLEVILQMIRTDVFLRKILQNKSDDNLIRINKYNRKINYLQKKSEKGNLSNIEKENIAEEIQSLIRERSELTISLEKNNYFSGYLNDDIVRSLYIIMKSVSIKNGYNILLEKNNGVIYVDEEFDLTREIIKILKEKKKEMIEKNE